LGAVTEKADLVAGVGDEVAAFHGCPGRNATIERDGTEVRTELLDGL
jgi:hypothetical protein